LRGTSLNSISADGGENSQQQIFDGLLEILEELSESGPTEAEVEAESRARAQRLRNLDSELG
jgi:hypothetical protein